MAERVYIAGIDEIPAKISVGKDELLSMTVIVFPGFSGSIPLEVLLKGSGSEAQLRGLYISSGEDKLSFDIKVRHEAPMSRSSQLFNGIAAGSASVSFHGLILVPQDCQKIKAFQENHNILLNESATVETSPTLEIYADDVECSHGATTGSLDPTELFYMRSRGIPETEARTLQMLSFLAPVLSGISDPVLRRRIARRVEKAVRGL